MTVDDIGQAINGVTLEAEAGQNERQRATASMTAADAAKAEALATAEETPNAEADKFFDASESQEPGAREIQGEISLSTEEMKEANEHAAELYLAEYQVTLDRLAKEYSDKCDEVVDLLKDIATISASLNELFTTNPSAYEEALAILSAKQEELTNLDNTRKRKHQECVDAEQKKQRLEDFFKNDKVA